MREFAGQAEERNDKAKEEEAATCVEVRSRKQKEFLGPLVFLDQHSDVSVGGPKKS